MVLGRLLTVEVQAQPPPVRFLQELLRDVAPNPT
jgi:hypothetical protein